MVAVDADGNPIPPSTYNPGVASPTGGGTSNGFDFHPDDVRTLAKATLKTAGDLEAKTFKNLNISPETFEDFDGGAGISEAHTDAHGRTLEELANLKGDLESFGGFLNQAVDDTLNVDDQIRALLLKLAQAPDGSAND